MEKVRRINFRRYQEVSNERVSGKDTEILPAAGAGLPPGTLGGERPSKTEGTADGAGGYAEINAGKWKFDADRSPAK